ncbi:39932_t:CDS:2, partial [Gigaspora margarita]
IKKLFQKKEQKIVGILEKFKNRVLKKDKVVTKYLEIQHVELICIIREIIEEYDYIQHKIARAKDMLLQLECGTYNYSTKELQTTINGDKSAHRPYKHKLEARELQEEITTEHINSRRKQESHPTEVDCSIHDKVREDISASRWALCNRIKLTSTNQTQSIQEVTTMTNQSSREEYNPNKKNLPKVEPLTKTGHSNTRERNYRKQQEQSILHQRRDRSPSKLDLMKYNKSGLFNRQENTKTPCDMSSTGPLTKRKLLKEILEKLSNLEEKQKKTEEGKKSKTYKAIVQLSKCIRKEKKNQTQKIDTVLREEMIQGIREINKKLNIEIASIGEYWSNKADKNHAKLKEIQERINDRCEIINGKQGKMLASLLDKPFNKIKIDRLVKENGLQRSLLLERDKILVHTKEHFSSQFKEKVNEDITEEEWEQAVLTASNKSAPGASGISYTLIKMAGPFPQQIYKEFTNMCLIRGQVPRKWKLATIYPIPKMDS